MSSYINSIKLINWFNYNGEDNLIEFTKGTNVIVGTNNAGKSKLFNAFKYIIHDEIILKQIENDRPISKPTKLSEKNFLEVFNLNAFNLLPLNEKSKLGVELMFTKERESETTTWVLTKYIHFRKISDSVISDFKEVSEVYQFFPMLNSKRRRDESFSSTVNLLIPNIYSDFFLVEGEQMGMMTPLRGNGLKTTVNNLTSIRSIDENAETFQKLSYWSKREYREIINKGEKGDKKLQELEQRLKEKEEEFESELETHNKFDSLVNQKGEEIKSKEKEFTKSKKDEALRSLQSLKQDEKEIEKRINQFQRNFLNSLTSTEFLLSKLEKDENLSSEIVELLENIHWFSSERRNEISKKVDEKEMRYLKKFIHNQPQPEILEEMLEEKVCFVCTSPITKDGHNFIENKLIPHLKGEYENEDDEIKFLGSVHNSLSEITNSSKKYIPFFETSIEEKLEEYSILNSELHEKKNEINAFISQNGDESDLKTDDNIFKIYDTLLKEQTKGEIYLDMSKKTLKRLGDEISKLKDDKKKIIEENGEGKVESNWRKLNEFFEDLAKATEEIKENVYREFAKNLEDKASSRFQSLMRHNPSIKGQKLTVNINKENEHSSDYSFKIELKDKNGVVLGQTGGASSTIEPLSAIFGLIDMSENRTKAPFIADAPISRMTPDSKFTFFETIVSDEILGQTIIILMDLWDDRNSGLNKIGEEVKNLLNKKGHSSIQFIIPNSFNTGVNIQKA